MSTAFRQGLDMRYLRRAVGIVRSQMVYGADVRLVPPRGRAQHLVPNEEPRAAAETLAALRWRRVTWRQGTKGPLTARFPAIRVRDGPVRGNNRHLPGEEAWLVGERRTSGERKYTLFDLGPGPRCAPWRPRSKHPGFVVKGTSSSSWGTSRGARGRGCTDTR